MYLVARSTSNDATFRFKIRASATWDATIDDGGEGDITESSSNLPLIIGVVIGGLALIACIAIIIWKIRSSKAKS